MRLVLKNEVARDGDWFILGPTNLLEHASGGEDLLALCERGPRMPSVLLDGRLGRTGGERGRGRGRADSLLLQMSYHSLIVCCHYQMTINLFHFYDKGNKLF